MKNEDIVTVYCPAEEWEGDLMVQQLKAAGIPAFLANRATSTMVGATGKVWTEILVPQEKAGEARELIKRILEARKEE